MPIIKRGQYYWIDYYHQGKRRRESLKTSKLLEAKDRARQLEEKLRQADSGPLLEDFAKQYMDWAKSTKPASAPRESQRLDKILTVFKAEGILTLRDISPLAVEKLRAHLSTAGRIKIVKAGDKKKLVPCGLSKPTVNRYLQLLRGMFYRAKDWGLYSGDNPLRKVRFFREESPIRVPSAEEIQRIREAARAISSKPRSRLQAAFSDLVELALNTGLRKSELLTLRWRDVREGEAHVRGKGDRVRKVPLNQAARAVIEKQPRADEYVFDIPNRRQPDLLRRTVVMAGKLAGVPWHFHLLRHRFASDLLERGIDVVTISEILGHSRVTTSLIYSHSSAERKAQAVRALERPGKNEELFSGSGSV